MQQIDWREFYFGDAIQPIAIEKYILDDGTMKETRQMTYECWFDNDETKEVVGMSPTFEVDDVVTRINDTNKMYCINKYERVATEILIELLDSDMRRTGKTIYVEENELIHVVKDVEWI